ncbi:peptidylprolyl isomerase [Candidatus Nitrosotenuis chungbukensis]|uniref:peptidylprolyl isomerase n=1 Tax=Candidatus Nitrosotenuis chungbukensis TaxID=1353246 RepID=UPI0005B26EE9|nr:peptidylprolyl isomerase [Candidatus Nitrosotenuis chungbukensis]
MLKFGLVFSLASVVVFLGILPVFAQTTEVSDKVVVLHTQSGDMVIELFPNDAPKTVANFLNLTEHQIYDRTVFHRVIKDFMIQGGDPKSKPGASEHFSDWGSGDVGYTIPGEFNTIKHKRGIVSMARGFDPDSASSQFFIVHEDSFFLDQNYAAFGRLATNTSYETLDKIANLTTGGEQMNNRPLDFEKGEILKAEVKMRAEIPDLLDLGEPERVESFTNQNTQEYSTEKFDISFLAPAGWLVQEPPTKTPNSPDIVAVGPKIAGFTPAISISVKAANGTSLDDYSNEIKNSLQKTIDAGNLSILSEDKTAINGNEAITKVMLAKFNTGSGQINVKFKETIIKANDKFYILTYTNSDRNFDNALDKFSQVVDSFKTTAAKTPNPDSSEKSGCLIATAAYGSELAPQVQLLREVRDNVLGTNSGTSFMTAFNAVYYSFSPTISDWERQSPIFKDAVRITLQPLLSSLSILNYAEIDSEQEMLGYGIGVILLNIGMYFVVPAIIIVKSKNKIQKFIAKT